MSTGRAQRVWTLKQVAGKLGVTYTWVWMNVSKGLLRTVRLRGRIHGVPDDELKRFASNRRPRGRPPKSPPAEQKAERRRSPRSSILSHYGRMSSSVRSVLTRARYYRVARFRLLPLREEFTEGPDGDRAWEGAIRQRLDDLNSCKRLGVLDYRDQALVLKLHGRAVPQSLLDRALMSYAFVLSEFVNSVTDAVLKDVARKFARRPWTAHPGTKSMPLEERARAMKASMRMFFGPVSQEEAQLAFRAVGADPVLFAKLSETLSEKPTSLGGSVSEAFSVRVQKIVDLVRSCVTPRDDGKYAVKPSWTTQEMEQAWGLARLILSQVPDNVRKDPKLAVRDHVMNIAVTVLHCLIVVKELGDRFSDIGAALGAKLCMGLVYSAGASGELKEATGQIVDSISRPPQSLADLLRRLNSLSVIIHKSSMSPEEKEQARRALQFVRSLATDSKKTDSEKYREMTQLLRRHLGLAPV